MQTLRPDTFYQHPGSASVFSFAFTSRASSAQENALALRQVHGSHIETVHPSHAGRPADAWLFEAPSPARAAIFVADCLPVALYAPESNRAAIAHCGHRGLAGELLARAGERLDSKRIVAWLGPCIGACCYQVQADVAERFARWDPALAPHPERGWWLDLRRVAELQLKGMGAELLGRVEECTFCRPDLFHSYRRGNAAAGRQSLIGSMGVLP